MDGNDARLVAGERFTPKFDRAGLLCAIAVDVADDAILMVAYMDQEALAATRDTGVAHFHSRSRQALWKKGETSGHMLQVRDIRIDCDQDAVWLIVEPAGPACHTGARSCFYRRVTPDGLERVD